MSDETKTPTKEIVAGPSNTTETIDARGRVYSLRKPSVLSQYRLIEMVGGHAASNPVYMNMVMPLLYIDKIDDDNAINVSTKRELEALIKRLGDDGVEAVMMEVQKHWHPVDPDEAKDSIKK